MIQLSIILSDEGTPSTTHVPILDCKTIRPMLTDGILQLPQYQIESCAPVEQIGALARTTTVCGMGLDMSLSCAGPYCEIQA